MRDNSIVTGPEAPPPGEPDRSMRRSVAEACFTAVHMRITSGSLLTALALGLGARDFHIGLLAALAALAPLGNIANALLAHRMTSRRRATARAALWGRGLWLVPVLALNLPLPDGVRLTVLLLTAFASGVIVNFGANAWMAWISDLVPAGHRGRFFSLRNALAGTVDMLTAYGAGRLYDLGRDRGFELSALSGLFVLAVLASMAAAWFFSRQWEPRAPPESFVPAAGKLGRPFRNRPFRMLFAFGVGWGLVTGVASPFFVAHMIKNLEMRQSVIAIYPIAYGIVSLLVQPFWGRLVDRHGNRPVLFSTLACIVFLPLIWLPATTANLTPIWIDAVLSGFLFPGFNIASFNLLLGTADRDNRSACFAVYSLGTGLATFAAGLTGGWLAEWTAGFQWRVAGLTLLNFHLLFMLTSAGRLCLLPLAARLHDERAASVGVMITQTAGKLWLTMQENWSAGRETARRLISRNGRD
jgi:MFS family permease